MIGLERRGENVFYLRATADWEARELARVLEQASALRDVAGRLAALHPNERRTIRRSVDHVINGLCRNVPIQTKDEEG